MIEGTTSTSTTSQTDGSSGPDAAGALNQQLGKDEFLKLLVAQMKNQNPMNPMKGREMAAQLAQFSSVEQLIQLNENFSAQKEGQEKIQRTINHGTAAEMIGNHVLARGDRVQVPESGDGSVTVDLAEGGSATLELFNDAGEKVGSRDLGYLESGRHEVSLGTADDGLDPGAYRYEVSLEEGDGSAVTTYSSGIVDGVHFTLDGPVLRVGDMEIPFGRIEEVSSASS